VTPPAREPSRAFRIDVRDATRAAAAAEFQFHGTCLALVSAELVDEWVDWSAPVQIKVVRNPDGLLDFEIRSVAL
jgi:hypothetical protein